MSFADTLMIRDLHQNKHELPFAPGMEVAGRVAEAGAGVEGLSPGDRVMALVYDGGHAECAVAPAAETFPLPEGVSMPAAAALGAAYLTAHAGLFWEARLEAGETLLVLGAGGGTGLAAVEVGKALGARVIAAASTAEKCALAGERGRRCGAHLPGGLDPRTRNGRNRRRRLRRGVRPRRRRPLRGELPLARLGRGGMSLSASPAGRFRPSGPIICWSRTAPRSASRCSTTANAARTGCGPRPRRCWTGPRPDRIRPHIAAELPLDEASAALRAIMDRKAAGRLILRP